MVRPPVNGARGAASGFVIASQFAFRSMPIPWVSGHALARSVEKVDMSRGCPGEAGFAYRSVAGVAEPLSGTNGRSRRCSYSGQQRLRAWQSLSGARSIIRRRSADDRCAAAVRRRMPV
ncbi:hypothetical protein WS67_08315 [Burkholderia singularis]|uniref:Uncharacterized protein n=1 Tax=Burkholderia singularis TaxID=1503053 RepID=A0A103E5G9_9BURK|nr:hypothetical protein WS67_08315 [Burkholderia singularis]